MGYYILISIHLLLHIHWGYFLVFYNRPLPMLIKLFKLSSVEFHMVFGQISNKLPLDCSNNHSFYADLFMLLEKRKLIYQRPESSQTIPIVFECLWPRECIITAFNDIKRRHTVWSYSDIKFSALSIEQFGNVKCT